MRRAVCTIALMNEPALSASERLSSDLGTINAKRPLSSSFLRYVRRAARISSLYTPGSSSTECQGTVTAVTVFFPEGISAVPEAAFSRETTFSSDVLNVRLSSMRTREFFSARNKGFCFIFYPALKTTFKLKKKTFALTHKGLQSPIRIQRKKRANGLLLSKNFNYFSFILRT